MSTNTAFKVLSVALLALLVVAFTPLADGDPGTWQNTVGDIVWSGIFLAFAGLLVTAALALSRRRAGRSVDSS